jgi:hypothetical protein
MHGINDAVLNPRLRRSRQSGHGINEMYLVVDKRFIKTIYIDPQVDVIVIEIAEENARVLNPF